MNQPALFHETITDALREVVQTLGGAKKVGAQMRPEKPIDEAARWVLDCLNHDRRERFDPEQVVWILREGRKAGCHSAMHYLAGECGYTAPSPLEPADEMAELRRQYIEAARSIGAIAARIERAESKA